jgi:hypothetical protein
VRGTAFDPAHKVADRDMWWYLDEHVDMLSGQTPETICTPSSLDTCRMMVRIRSRRVPSRTL